MGIHETGSEMLYIHPPLAIVGYFFIFLFTVLLFKIKKKDSRLLRFSGLAAWLFTFLGLVTGMLWAQVAWGTYWSWDPKETMTFLLFISVSVCLVGFFEKNRRISIIFAVLSCSFSILTISMSFVTIGLHSFLT